MARYTGADCKRCRREKMKLFLKGSKCESPKCPIEIRPYPPGEHGRGRTKDSEYLLQMREKQKCARIYGVLEKQFRGYYDEANRRQGKTGENLLRILESRLDNVIYRAGLARTRRMARQLVSHGHFTVNGVRVNIPSYRVSQYDIIDIKPKSLNTLPFEVARETAGDRPIPGWLQVIGERQRILVHQLPERAQIDIPLTEQLIVELYSK
jgi:small subunit ribosomal protein S4